MVGLDIGSNSIKVVNLAPEGKKWKLLAAGITGTPPPGMAGASERDFVAIASAIKKLLKDAKISEKNVVISLPESSVFTRLVSFPPLSDQEIASAIGWQIEGYIPISKKDAVYDHQVVRKGEKEVEALIIAASKTVVSRYLRVVQLAGLSAVAVETELIALTRSVVDPDKRSLIIDFGATSTDIAVVVAGQLMFSRSVQTAGQALTRAVAQGIGVAAGQAEEYKKTYGLEPQKLEGKVKEALDPIVTLVIDEIKKAMGYWREDHPELPIETIIVSGGTAGLPALVTLLSANLGMEIIIGNPFGNVLMDATSQKGLAPFAPLYSIATGLAMREG